MASLGPTSSALHAEALALLAILSLLESMKSAYHHPWEVSVLIIEARQVLGQSKHLSLAHCSSDSNRLADWLCKAHRLNELPSHWVARPFTLFGIFFVSMPLMWALLFKYFQIQKNKGPTYLITLKL